MLQMVFKIIAPIIYVELYLSAAGLQTESVLVFFYSCQNMANSSECFKFPPSNNPAPHFPPTPQKKSNTPRNCNCLLTFPLGRPPERAGPEEAQLLPDPRPAAKVSSLLVLRLLRLRPEGGGRRQQGRVLLGGEGTPAGTRGRRRRKKRCLPRRGTATATQGGGEGGGGEREQEGGVGGGGVGVGVGSGVHRDGHAVAAVARHEGGRFGGGGGGGRLDQGRGLPYGGNGGGVTDGGGQGAAQRRWAPPSVSRKHKVSRPGLPEEELVALLPSSPGQIIQNLVPPPPPPPPSSSSTLHFGANEGPA